MKKFIYSLVIASVLALTFSSCTEEEIAPQELQLNGGGNGDIGKL